MSKEVIRQRIMLFIASLFIAVAIGILFESLKYVIFIMLMGVAIQFVMLA